MHGDGKLYLLMPGSHLALEKLSHAVRELDSSTGRILQDGELIDALSTRNIEPVMFKGTALAYGVYASQIFRKCGKRCEWARLEAHAWLRCGSVAVTGGDGREFTTVIEPFVVDQQNCQLEVRFEYKG